MLVKVLGGFRSTGEIELVEKSNASEKEEGESLAAIGQIKALSSKRTSTRYATARTFIKQGRRL